MRLREEPCDVDGSENAVVQRILKPRERSRNLTAELPKTIRASPTCPSIRIFKVARGPLFTGLYPLKISGSKIELGY